MDVHKVLTDNSVQRVMVLTTDAKISGRENGAAAFTNDINQYKITVVLVVWIIYDMIYDI
jgi:hypothetical protein